MLCCRHAGCYLLLIAHPSFCRVATGSADNNRPSCSAKLFSFAKQHKQDVPQMFSSTLCLLRTGFSKSIVNSIAFNITFISKSVIHEGGVDILQSYLQKNHIKYNHGGANTRLHGVVIYIPIT